MKGFVIAIVEDDQSLRESMSSFVRSCGFAAVTFPSGEDFLASPQLQGIDCLVAYVNLPGMSGLDLYRRLAYASHNIPTVLVTAHPDEPTRAR